MFDQLLAERPSPPGKFRVVFPTLCQSMGLPFSAAHLEYAQPKFCLPRENWWLRAINFLVCKLPLFTARSNNI